MNIIRAADFSGIEARMIAWLAGEDAKLEVFRRADRKEGPDTYQVAAAAIYGVPVEKLLKSDSRRQVGKVAELALGFQGGPGAFAKMAKTYNVDISLVFDTVWESATAFNRDAALDAYQQRGKTSGMAQKKWLAAELIKLAWRDANPAIVQLWYDCEAAAIAAVEQPGRITHAGPHICYRKAGSWLFCRLPSGRAIAYAYPRIVQKPTPWGDRRPGIVFKGVDSFTKKWCDQDFYGGLGAHNATQGGARDVMAEAMLRAEAASYEIILTVHDELVSETDANFGSLDEFCAIVAHPPQWAGNLPITVEGWEGPRYRK